MPVREITAPVVEPVSLDQAKTWCRIDDTGDAVIDDANDALLTMLIKAMREYAENLTGRAFVQRTLELALPWFPSGGVIVLPCPPLVSVTSVKYIDYAGVLQTVPDDEYEVDTDGEPGRVQPAYLQSWNGTRNVFNAVRVRYEAGYAPSSSPTDYRENVPASVKVWMQARLATLWEQREQLITGTIVAEIPRGYADGLLDSLVIGARFG